jgi:hypothetical protein
LRLQAFHRLDLAVLETGTRGIVLVPGVPDQVDPEGWRGDGQVAEPVARVGMRQRQM